MNFWEYTHSTHSSKPTSAEPSKSSHVTYTESSFEFTPAEFELHLSPGSKGRFLQ